MLSLFVKLNLLVEHRFLSVAWLFDQSRIQRRGGYCIRHLIRICPRHSGIDILHGVSCIYNVSFSGSHVSTSLIHADTHCHYSDCHRRKATTHNADDRRYFQSVVAFVIRINTVRCWRRTRRSRSQWNRCILSAALTRRPSRSNVRWSVRHEINWRWTGYLNWETSNHVRPVRCNNQNIGWCSDKIRA